MITIIIVVALIMISIGFIAGFVGAHFVINFNESKKLANEKKAERPKIPISCILEDINKQRLYKIPSVNQEAPRCKEINLKRANFEAWELTKDRV